jgi:hypothetical protein
VLVKAAECSIKPSEFWEMTWKDYSIVVLGTERKELNEWARTRNLAYIIYLSSSADKNPKSIKSFWHIPQLDDIEDEAEEVMLSNEELSRTLALYGIN